MIVQKVYKGVLTLLLLVPNLALAKTGVNEGSIIATNMWQVLMSLVFVLGIILLLAYVYRKTSLNNYKGNEHIKIMASVSVGVKEKVMLVSLGESQLLLGVTNQSINVLQVLTGDEKIKASSSVASSSFSKKLKEVMGKQ